MNFGYSFSGGAPVVKKYRVASGSSAVAGGYVSAAVANGSGVVKGLVTTVVLQVGSTLDAATGSTAPTADGNAVTSVIVNPDAVYRLLIVKGATGGQVDVLTESTGGSKTANTITTGETAPNSPSMDEGTITCISGVNLGTRRKITSVSATVATITEGWVTANVAGDVFMLLPWCPEDGPNANIQLTTDLTSARADIASGTGANMRPVELDIKYSSTAEARNGSYVLARFNDSIFSQIVTVDA